MVSSSKETVRRSIQKYLQIQNRADAEVEVVAIGSNAISGRTPLVVVNSTLTIDQSNKAQQQVELLYVIDAMADADLSEEETQIISGIIASNGGFYSQSDLQTALSLPSDAEIEVDGDVVTATYPTGEVKEIQTVELIEQLADEYIQNEDIYEEKRQELSIQLDAAVKAIQSNSIEIDNCKFIDSDAELMQLNRSIQAVKAAITNKASSETDNSMTTDRQRASEADISANASIDDSTKSISNASSDQELSERVSEVTASKLNLSKLLFIVILIVAIALITASLIFVYTSPIRTVNRQ